MPQLIGEPPGRITPLDELVNTSEFEDVARRRLDSLTFDLIAGADRKAFDRITLRPRMMVNTTKLDLSSQLLGQPMFAPILVAPVAQQKRFHPEGELATARGASAARAVMVIADRSGFPVDQILAQAKGSAWFQIAPEADVDAVRARVRTAVTAGCKAVCLTAGGWDWTVIDRFRQGMTVPLVLKGIMSAEEAKAAVQHGVQAIIVSNYVEGPSIGYAPPMEVLPGIADAVAGRIPILIDGGFRRGSDVLMALALGASAVMVARPVMWGLAAYGADGVQHVVEMLQTELARDMAMCGKVNLKALDKTAVKLHRW
ncbi:MAG: alpha-hydroxy-acid oxidizing protein [Acidobacteriota bacterium]|nr:alpha-hydroxy-acid oxidizing protein [Acidobacteriota bacterium]